MREVFSGSEIIELGIEIEKNGRDFYNILARQSEFKEAGKIFKFLAEQEGQHIIVFAKILDSFEKNRQQPLYPDEYLAYMNSLASKQVFTQKKTGDRIAKNIAGLKEAIDAGIGFERDSILFYQGIKKIVPSKQRSAVRALIFQERRHLEKLMNLKKKPSF
jgi:rubrerythrin